MAVNVRRDMGGVIWRCHDSPLSSNGGIFYFKRKKNEVFLSQLLLIPKIRIKEGVGNSLPSLSWRGSELSIL